MNKLQMVYYGDPLLRKRAEELPAVTDEIRSLLDAMLQKMDESNGIGLAAPQIGSPIRLFILRNHHIDEEDKMHLTDPQCYINPKITLLETELVFAEEGCLSIPGIREEVGRPLHLKIEALDRDGNLFVEEVKGYKARVILHENDHLNGVLFIDRVEPDLRQALQVRLRALKQKFAPKSF